MSLNNRFDIVTVICPEVGGVAEEVHGEIEDGNEEEDEESSETLHRLRSVTNNECNKPLYLVSGCCLNSLLAEIYACPAGVEKHHSQKQRMWDRPLQLIGYGLYFSGPQGSWSVHVCCLRLKKEFCSCARGRQWCGIIHYY